MLTTQEKIDVGYVSTILAENELASGKINGNSLDKRLPTLLYAVTTGLEWLYELDSSNSDISKIGNYLISICRNAPKAEQLLAIGGGGAIPGISSDLPLPKSFIVSASSYMPTGATTKTIPEYTGYNLLIFRGGVQQSDINTEPTYYEWSRSGAVLTITPGLAEEELIFMMPTR